MSGNDPKTQHTNITLNFSNLNSNNKYNSSHQVYIFTTLEYLILVAFSYAILYVSFYSFVTIWQNLSYTQSIRPVPRRLLLVTAHPDDECMFFGPTILHYTLQDNNNNNNRSRTSVHLMCLSADRVRKKELYAACCVLGIAAANVSIVSHEKLPDALGKRWPLDVVSALIRKQIETLDIDTVVTFDRYGISGHTNHQSVYYALVKLVLDGHLPVGCDVFTLESVNVIRKYWSFLDLPFNLFQKQRYFLDRNGRNLLIKAMYQHTSQIVWFRKLYIIFSRYYHINTLQIINVNEFRDSSQEGNHLD